MKPAKHDRSCPACGETLSWVETQRIRGVSFDYYTPCSGCAALVCFNRVSETFDVLIPGIQPDLVEAPGIRLNRER